jgi:hypothetical protein
LLGRFFVRSIDTIRKPIAWGSTVPILLAIGIAITLHAQRTRKTHQEMAFAWLDELDAKLTDGFIAEIKGDPTPTKADSNSRIPVSAEAHSLLADARIKGDNAIRIYVPLNQDDYSAHGVPRPTVGAGHAKEISVAPRIVSRQSFTWVVV